MKALHKTAYDCTNAQGIVTQLEITNLETTGLLTAFLADSEINESNEFRILPLNKPNE